MKKILWLIIVFPIFMSKAWASEVYYSEYGNFSDYQEKFISSSDIVNVESKVMYKWYKNIKIPGEYKLYNSFDNFLNNCYETNYSNWSSIKPIVNEATILEEKTIYNYQMITPVRYIHLYNLKGSYDAFRISELQVFVDDLEIDYTYNCNGCWTNFDEYIHNGVYAENKSYIDNNGSLIIDLGAYYPINKVKVLFYLFDMGEALKQYTLGYSTDGVNILFNQNFEQQFTLVYVKDSKKYEYMITDLDVSNDKWLTLNTSEEYINNEYVYSYDSYKQYRYKEKMCQTYTLEKEYYPQYSEVAIGDYNSKDTEKTFYRCQVRDKLELNVYDITNKNFDLNNFVVSSTNNYTIVDNINWNKNGNYKVKFTLNNLVVDKDVNLVILENSLAEKDEQIKILESQLENAINDYEKIISTLEKTNEEYLKSLNDLNIKIVDINNKIIELEKLDDVNISSVEDLKEKLNNHIKEYDLKVEEFENINKNFLESIQTLSNSVSLIKEKINTLEKVDIEYKNELNSKIDNYIIEFNKKIIFLEEKNEEYKKELYNIELYIKSIDEKINNLEEKYNIVLDKVNILEKELKEIDEINTNIENLLTEIKSIDSIQDDKISNIQSRLEEQMNLYQDKINNLELINSDYLEDLNELEEKISVLEEELKKEGINKSELQKDLESTFILYNNKIKEIEKFNKTYSEKIVDLNLKINDLIIEIKNSEIFSENLYNDLNNRLNIFSYELESVKDEANKILEDKIFDIEKKLEDINLSSNNKYDILVTEQDLLNTKIDAYENYIEKLKQSNESYLYEIDLLKEEIISISNKLDDLNKQFNNKYNELNENQEMIYDELIINSKFISSYNDNLEYIKSNLLEVDSDNYEDDLNSKLNNFVLKIDGVDKINLLWIYIGLSLIFVIYVIYKFQKKSNKNNS